MFIKCLSGPKRSRGGQANFCTELWAEVLESGGFTWKLYGEGEGSDEEVGSQTSVPPAIPSTIFILNEIWTLELETLNFVCSVQ